MREGSIGGRSAAKGKRAARRLVGAALIVPLLATPVAHQDMTSLIEGGRAVARWQAFFVPAPAGSIEVATLGLAAKGGERLPAGSGFRSPDGALYSTDTRREAFEAPDEARVNRREKTGRVLAASPAKLLPASRGFSAGAIPEREAALRPSLGREAALRVAFRASGEPASVGAVMTAFAAVPSIVPDAPPAVMLAAKPASRKGHGAKEAPVVLASATPVGDGSAGTAALAYATPDAGENPASGLFGRILRGSAGDGGFIPPLGRGDHAWAATALPASSYSKKEQLCLANGIYFEARGESEQGQAAVAQVILNRVRNPTYPKTICGVVYQNQNWRNRCQFSFACDGHRKRVTNKRAFSTALRIADEVTRGKTWLAEVGSATHYHATYVRPRWAGAMRKVDKIGRHVFYRTYGGGWR